MDALVQVFGELKTAEAIGESLSTPSIHFVRVIRLFAENERKILLNTAYEDFQKHALRPFSLDQFIAWGLFSMSEPDNLGEEPSFHYGSLFRVEPIFPCSPHQIRLEEFDEKAKSFIAIVRTGRHPAAIAALLSRVNSWAFGSAELSVLSQLAKEIESPITRPELAAAISQCFTFNRKLTEAFVSESQILVDYARIVHAQKEVDETDLDAYGKITLEEHDSSFFAEVLSKVEALTQSDDLMRSIRLNRDLKTISDFPQRFGFVETPYGLFVPSVAAKRIGDDFATLTQKACKDRSTLLSLSSREFEQFISDIFRALGYQVELTKATRDGGADLVCLRVQDGIPFRLAVEVKRYREDRPISVQLIRSFVGANKQFEANKLIYITTSSYTKPAIEFADAYAPHLLSLKSFEQIHEWCEEVGRQSWSILK